MAKLSDRQQANLWNRLDQLRPRIAAAEQNLAQARARGETHSITALARTVRTLHNERAAINRKLGAAARQR